MSDSEHTGLMATQPEPSRKKQPPPDWGRYGLNQEPVKDQMIDTMPGEGYQHTDADNKNELFQEDLNLSQKLWWKANFFISEPVLFGTWDGVFTSCLINLLGVVIFLRMGWIVGNAGISLTIVTIVLAVMVVLIVALSGIGVCERCHMESGGVYFLISHVLGARIGGSVGVVYCFAQSVSCSLSVMGFGESIMGLTGLENPWVAKGVAIGLVILLLGINVAGVKWVIRLQLLLLFMLFLSVMDFMVGSFVHTDYDSGVTGYHEINFRNNSAPDYEPGEGFFSIFGLFFSTVTGILAGINMSGDLRDPFTNIPRGTLAALGFSTFLYITFTLILGATCVRTYLHEDYMISEKVSVVGVLWLAGLYISSVSSCIESLYYIYILCCRYRWSVFCGWPVYIYLLYHHVWGVCTDHRGCFKTIANENVIPIIRVLGHGRGPNKVPIYALILITLVVLLFVLVGDVNTLAPIVTTAFMMSYCAVNYAYFALAMSYDKRQERDLRFGQKPPSKDVAVQGYGSTNLTESNFKDSFQNIRTDLDKLFPERMTQRGQHHLLQQGQGSPTTPEADFDATKKSKSLDNVSEHSDASQVLLGKEGDPRRPPNMEITKQPRSWYSFLCNRWLSLFGTLICVVIMFGTQWAYGLGELIVAIIVYIYIGQANPGYFPGIAEFNFYDWMKGGIRRCLRGGGSQEEIIVAPTTPAVTTLAAQLTEDNEDFASRGRYHQSEVVHGENFDDYDSDD